MIPFSSSLLCVRPGRNPFHGLCIIEPAGIILKTNDDQTPHHGIHIVIPDVALAAEMEGEQHYGENGIRMEDGSSRSSNNRYERANNISSAEWILLETLDCRLNRPLHAGPFLTVQRRRRRRKYVRTYLFKDPTLIDDLSVHQTNFLLARINQWAFNAFILDNVTGGRPLPTLCVHLFKAYGLFEHFNLDPVIIWKLFSIIEDGYHWRNPYHNGVHAADVTQAMHCFLQEQMILAKLTPLEIFSAILAAVTHDLDHPGVNQPFLIATSNHLAALYKNSSVLENHHWRSAMGCLNESGVSAVLGCEIVAQVEEQIKSLVLATDITRQQEFLMRLKEYLDTDTLDMDDAAVRHFVLQIALKCADISNPCRPWDISRKWSMKVCEEFFRQGDYERQLNLPVTPLCDRYSSSVPKIQTGFYQFVVRPLFTEWHRALHTPLSTRMMENLDSNKIKWDQMLRDEVAAKEQQLQLQQQSIKSQSELSDDESSNNGLQGNSELDSTTVRTGGNNNNHRDSESSRSVRFDPLTTVTAASDSEGSEDGAGGADDDEDEEDDNNLMGKVREETGFLGVPGPYARRHSIATGLMGSHIQVPPGGLLSAVASACSSRGGSTLSITDMVANSRTVGRTVIRRESLPGTVGRTLPTKTILHLQRLSSSGGGGGGSSSSGGRHASGDSNNSDSTTTISTTGATVGSGMTVTGDFGEIVPPSPVSPSRKASSESATTAAKGSRSSSSTTTDEILDFTYSLPETVGGRSSGSPSRRLLHETTDLDELCPGTSILSMSPSVAHVTLHQSSSGGGGGGEIEEQRRHLIRQHTCPVVSITDGSGNFNRPRFLSAAAAVSPTAVASSSILTGASSRSSGRNRSPEISGGGDESRISGGSSSEALVCEVIDEEGDRGSSEASSKNSSAEASPLEIYVRQFPPEEDNEAEAPRIVSDTSESSNNNNFSGNSNKNAQQQQQHNQRSSFDLDTVASGTSFDDSIMSQTGGMEGGGDDDSRNINKKRSSCPAIGSAAAGQNAANMAWKTKRVWKSLTEEDDVEYHTVNDDMDVEDIILSSYYHGGNALFSYQQQQQQGIPGRFLTRRGSAPTTGMPPMGCRGGQDRRSDPTQYRSHSFLANLNNNIMMASFLREPELADYAGSKGLFRPVNPKGMPRMGRRGSLPLETSGEASYAYKWMQIFPYSEDEDHHLPKRRSSGGPELFAAAAAAAAAAASSSSSASVQQQQHQQQGSSTKWKAQVLFNNKTRNSSSSINASSSSSALGYYWPGAAARRRGSLPLEVCIASSDSCSCESESSGGDGSDT